MPNNLESIGECAFYNCTNLKNLSLPKSLTQIGESAFESCNLSSVYVPNNNAHIGKYAFWSDNENPIILCNSTVQFDDDYNTVYYIDKSVPVKNFKDLYQSEYDWDNTTFIPLRQMKAAHIIPEEKAGIRIAIICKFLMRIIIWLNLKK